METVSLCSKERKRWRALARRGEAPHSPRPHRCADMHALDVWMDVRRQNKPLQNMYMADRRFILFLLFNGCSMYGKYGHGVYSVTRSLPPGGRSVGARSSTSSSRQHVLNCVQLCTHVHSVVLGGVYEHVFWTNKLRAIQLRLFVVLPLDVC